VTAFLASGENLEGAARKAKNSLNRQSSGAGLQAGE